MFGSKSTIERAVGDVDMPGMLRAAARTTLEHALSDDAKKAVPGLLGTAGAYETGKTIKRSRGVGKPTLLLAGGVAGVTAASAAISAVRRGHREA
jgi:hypothetical protein